MPKRRQPLDLPPPPLTTSQQIPQQTPFDIATNLLLRCEHFFRTLAFVDLSTSEQTTKHLQKLCSDFHETLFIIDLSLHKYRTEHKFNEDDEESGDYSVLSDINEQLADFAFLVSKGMHPWDAPTKIDCSQQPSSSSLGRGMRTSGLQKKKDGDADKMQFPPATWKNRILRQTTTPLAGFPLEEGEEMET